MKPVLLTLSILVLAGLSSDVQAQKKGKQGQWAEGVTYTTSWDEAIKAARETGKMLLIYNGWEPGGI